MKAHYFLVALAILFLVSGCGSAKRKANKSQAKVNVTIEEVNEKRLEMIEEYEKCIKKAGNDAAAAERCDSYLKAAEALGQ